MVFATPICKISEAIVPWDAESRLRADARRGKIIDGFGNDGRIDLWFPPPKNDRKATFRCGKVHVEQAISCFDHPELLLARKRLVCASLVADPTIRQAAMTVLAVRYSAAMIRFNYDVEDGVLEYLHRGNHWFAGVIRHALDGVGED